MKKALIRAEGFNTPPLGAVKKVLKARLQFLIKNNHTPLLAAGLVDLAAHCFV
jgi:hypothetical protein